MLRTSFGPFRRRLSSDMVVSCAIRPTGACIDPNVAFDRRNRLYPTMQGIARSHTSYSLCIGSTSPHFMTLRSAVSNVPVLRKRRWMSSGKKGPPKEAKVEEPVKEIKEKVEEPGRLSSIVRSVGPTLRKVTEWNLGDLVSVYAIVLLIVLIIVSPYVIEQMKQADRTEDSDIDEYDPVAHAEKIVRYELFGNEHKEKEQREETKEGLRSVGNTVDMAADVLKSKALQEAIASLITRVLESVQFQEACQTLLKNLWNDLVNDPETTAQVVQLLNNAIQNKEIQRSVRRLVLQLIQDKEVYDELTRLLVRLGQEEEVRLKQVPILVS